MRLDCAHTRRISTQRGTRLLFRSGACGGLSGRNAKKTRVTFVALAWDRTVRRERFLWLLIQAPSPEQRRDVRLDKQRSNLGQG